MRTLMVVATLALGVALAGCAATQAGRSEGETRITRDTPIRAAPRAGWSSAWARGSTPTTRPVSPRCSSAGARGQAQAASSIMALMARSTSSATGPRLSESGKVRSSAVGSMVAMRVRPSSS